MPDNSAAVSGIPAAEYVRMSTDMQECSIANQQDYIARYAKDHGMRVIKTYADEGRSGLELKGREGLRSLLRDILSTDRAFDVILVYDVSRWGRFQDTDEGAYYEFLCRRAGARVIYCAEPFAQNSPMDAVMKSIKRAMAAEYSREHGERVLSAQVRLSRLGYHASGRPPLGYRRRLFDRDGRYRSTLGCGEPKEIKSDRVRLVLGPKKELQTVRTVFNLYLKDGIGAQRVANALNRRGMRTGNGKQWTERGVLGVLSNEIYKGVAHFNRMGSRLGAPRRLNSPGSWVEHAVPAVVTAEVFDAAAQKRLENRPFKYADQRYIAPLAALAKKNGGRLSTRILRRCKSAPSIKSYYTRYGSPLKLFAELGYVVNKAHLTRSDDDQRARKLIEALIVQVVGALQAQGLRCQMVGQRYTRVMVGDWQLSIAYKRIPRHPKPSALGRVFSNAQVALIGRTSVEGSFFVAFYLFDLTNGRAWHFDRREDAIEGVVSLFRRSISLGNVIPLPGKMVTQFPAERAPIDINCEEPMAEAIKTIWRR